ncbi:type II secretion system minor pseudopilin GspH [Pseudomonas sp. TMP25]|uniref:type II secretion system minor pseudopilin GspH n=1 Tax=Pseudomonas sp. TMP25 TaxID=3136561 RepID=UPI0031014190
MRQRPNQAKGFTLIELLVVLVILGSLIGIAVLSVGIAGPSRELHNEAERLAGLIGVLAEEAVLDNQEYGLLLSREAYQVLRYDSVKQSWQALSSKPHQLPGWAQLSVDLEGTALQLPQLEGGTPSQSSLTPQLLLLSSGEISPFRLRLAERRTDGVRLQIVSDGFQLPRVEIEQPAGSSR